MDVDHSIAVFQTSCPRVLVPKLVVVVSQHELGSFKLVAHENILTFWSNLLGNKMSPSSWSIWRDRGREGQSKCKIFPGILTRLLQ